MKNLNLNLALLPVAAAATMLMAAPAHALKVTGSDSVMSGGIATVSFTFDTEGEQLDFTAFDLTIDYDNGAVQFEPALISFTPGSAVGTIAPDFENNGSLFPAIFPGGVFLSWSIDTVADVQSAKGTGVLSLGFSDVALVGSTAVNLSLAYSTVDMGDLNVQSVATISAVPEPSALAMLFAGLGVVGAVARRRRAH